MIIILPILMIFILIYLIADKIINNTKTDDSYIQELIKEYEQLINQTNMEIKNNKKEIDILKRKIKNVSKHRKKQSKTLDY